jgi:DNA-binding Xre family transcriptional regulator
MTDDMTVSYNKLWKLLVDYKMSPADLRRAIGMGSNTLGKLRKDKVVALEVLMKICSYFDCNVGDIMDFIKTEKAESEHSETDADKQRAKE